MRGIAIDRFGGPETLTLRDDLPDPLLGPDVFVVRAHAASVNPVDTKVRAGALAERFPHHFPLIPGWDVAGVVEHAGPATTGIAEGDEVIGYVRRDDVQLGTYAELVTAPQRCLAPKPASLSMTEAAALPLAGLTAYQALTEALGISDGERLLIHNAAGGVGSFAVQLAHNIGAHVIASTGSGNHDYVRELGADETIDYHDGPASGQLDEKVDAVLDLIGGAALTDAPKQIHDGGRIASVIDAATVLGLPNGRYVFVRPDAAQLAALSAMVDAGALRVSLQETFALADAAEAHRRSEQGHVRGKLALQIA